MVAFVCGTVDWLSTELFALNLPADAGIRPGYSWLSSGA